MTVKQYSKRLHVGDRQHEILFFLSAGEGPATLNEIHKHVLAAYDPMPLHATWNSLARLQQRRMVRLTGVPKLRALIEGQRYHIEAEITGRGKAALELADKRWHEDMGRSRK